MKTIRTILATFGVTTLLYGLFALLMTRLNPVFTGRTIFQLFRETGFVTLVIGIGCVLSAVIMTVALVSFRDEGSRKKQKHSIVDDEDDLDEFLEEETVPEERAAEADETWSNEIKRKQRRALRHTDEDEEEEPYEYYAEDEEPEQQAIPIRQSYYEQAEPQQRREPEPEPQRPPVQQVYHEEPAVQPRPVIRSSFRSNPEKTEYRPATFETVEQTEEPTVPEPEETLAEPASEPQKFCVYCGKQIDADSTFCIYCGKRV